MNRLRGSVRPLVTFAFVGGQIVLAAAWAVGAPLAEPAFAALAPFSMLVLRDYFVGREQAERRA